MTAPIAQAQAQTTSQINQVQTASSSDLVFLWIALMVSFITVIVLLERMIHGKILPYEPRRQVPWSGADVLWIFMVVIMLQIVVMSALYPIMITPTVDNDKPTVEQNIYANDEIKTVDSPMRENGSAQGELGDLMSPSAKKAALHSNSGGDATAHPVVTIVLGGNPWMITFCVLVTVILVPISEEFLFRLLLQGWLEKVDAQKRRRFRWLARLPRGLLPIVMVSTFFALLHARTGEMKFDLEMLVFNFVVQAIVNLIGLIFGVWWLVRCGATAADFGWKGWTALLDDLLRGIFAFFLIAGPLYGLQLLMRKVMLSKTVVEALGAEIAPDPIAIFIFSVALGFLYFRTHRIATAIMLHVALNLTSMAMLAVTMLKG